MQKLTLAAFAAACLLATPVLAQANTNSSSTTANNTSQTKPMSQADLQRVQQKITNDLTSDGYTNVQVMPNSFLVHATNKRNEPVVMIINPDSVFAVTQLPSKQANTTHASNGNATTTHQ